MATPTTRTRKRPTVEPAPTPEGIMDGVKLNKSNLAEDVANRKEAFLKILEKSLGVKSTACAAMGITRTTVYNWIATDKEFAKEVEAIEDVALDFAESRLFHNMKAGTQGQASVIFFLKTKGKRRGYIEESHITTPPDNPFEMEVTEAEAASIASRILGRKKG